MSRQDNLGEAHPPIDLEPEIDNIMSDSEDEQDDLPPPPIEIDQPIQPTVAINNDQIETPHAELAPIIPVVPPPVAPEVVVVEIGHAVEAVVDIERDVAPDGVRDAQAYDEILQAPEPPPERVASPWERAAIEMRNIRNGFPSPPRVAAAARVTPPHRAERRVIAVAQVHREVELHPELDEFGLPVPPLKRRDACPPPDRRSRSPSSDDLMERFERIRRDHDAPASRRKAAASVRAPLAMLSKTTAAGDDFRPAKLPMNEDDVLRRRVECLLAECVDFNDAAVGQKLCGDNKEEARILVLRITEAYSAIVDLHDSQDADRLLELRNVRSSLKRKIIASDVVEPAPVPPPVHNPNNSMNSSNSSASSALLAQLSRHQITVEMQRLTDSKMPDVGVGVCVDPEDLKDLLRITVPEVKQSTQRLRESIKMYAMQPDADAQFAINAQVRCDDAIDWISTVEDRARMEQLHLDSTHASKEVDFEPWHPGSRVSIFEFLRKFESWSRGTHSQAAQAYALYSRHLDRSLVQSCKELEERKDSYQAMRDWLVQKWGRPSLVGDLYLSNIESLALPTKSSGPEANINYLKSLYSILITVTTLEVTRG